MNEGLYEELVTILINHKLNVNQMIFDLLH